MTEHICPVDGTPMYLEERPLTLTYKDKSTTFDMPGWYCHECGEGIHSGEDMKISDRMLNRLKASSEGLLEPEEICIIRKKLHLSQEDAGSYIGGGQRAFQKYESGDLLPSRAICNLLVVLDQMPDALKVIKENVERGRLQQIYGQNVSKQKQQVNDINLIDAHKTTNNKSSITIGEGARFKEKIKLDNYTRDNIKSKYARQKRTNKPKSKYQKNFLPLIKNIV